MERWHFRLQPQPARLEQDTLEEGVELCCFDFFSLGESSFREGTHSATEKSAVATAGRNTGDYTVIYASKWVRIQTDLLG